MDYSLAENGYVRKPLMLRTATYHLPAMARRLKPVTLPRDIRGTLARNVEFLMGYRDDLDSQPKVAAKADMAQSTVGRILRAEVHATCENLEGLARAFKVQPWQLLFPGLAAEHLIANNLDPRDKFAFGVIERVDEQLQHIAAMQERMLGMNKPSGAPAENVSNIAPQEKLDSRGAKDAKEDRPAKNARRRGRA